MDWWLYHSHPHNMMMNFFSSATWLDTQSDRYNATQAIFVHKFTWAEQSALYINYSFRKKLAKNECIPNRHSLSPACARQSKIIFGIYLLVLLCMAWCVISIVAKERAISFGFRCLVRFVKNSGNKQWIFIKWKMRMKWIF